MRELLAQFDELIHGSDIRNWYVVMVYVCRNPDYGYPNDSIEFPGGWDDYIGKRYGPGGSRDTRENIEHSRVMAIREYTQETTMPIRDDLHQDLQQLRRDDGTLFSNISRGPLTCGNRDRYSVKTEYRVFVCIDDQIIHPTERRLPDLIEGNVHCREPVDMRRHARHQTGRPRHRRRTGEPSQSSRREWRSRDRRGTGRPTGRPTGGPSQSSRGHAGPRTKIYLPPSAQRGPRGPTGGPSPSSRRPQGSRKPPPTGKGSWRK